MEKSMSAILLLLLPSLSGALTQSNLSGKVFVFPRPSDNSYVLLEPALKNRLQGFTLCLNFYTDLTRSCSLFSAASPQHDNEILFFKYPDMYEFCVHNQCITFRAPGNTEGHYRSWEKTCVTWDSTTGIAQLWLDGQPYPRKGIEKGYKIPTDIVVMLGQEQDSYGGSLDDSQSFVGEMAEVYLWDTVLPPEQIRWIRKDTAPTPLVNWSALNFEIKGYVLVEPTLQ